MKFIEIDIDILSPPVTGECTTSYFVRYKATGDVGWTLLNGTGLTLDNPVVIQPLAPSTEYLIQIRRNCCNGQQSAFSETYHTTSA